MHFNTINDLHTPAILIGGLRNIMFTFYPLVYRIVKVLQANYCLIKITGISPHFSSFQISSSFYIIRSCK